MGGDKMTDCCQNDIMAWLELQNLRNSRRWTYDQLAETSGISKSVLSRLERGERTPKVEHIKMLAKAFGVGDADLLMGVQTGHAPQSPSSPIPPNAPPLDAASATVRVDAERVGIEFDLGNAGTFRVTLSAEKAAILGMDIEEATKRLRRLSFDSPSSTS